MKRVVGAWVLVALPLFTVAPPVEGQAISLTRALDGFLAENFPGEAFMPAPSGGGQRFTPPAMWIRLKNAQGKSWSNGKEVAWVPFGDGLGVYPPSFVELHTDKLSLATLKMNSTSKLAVALALVGIGGADEIDAGLKVALDNGLEAEVQASDAQVVYGYYGDFLAAQERNTSALLAINAALKSRFNGRLPDRRVVTAALRVRNARIFVKSNKGSGFALDGATVEALAKIGLTWDANRSRTLELNSGEDWRILAFQALLADKDTGKISSLQPEEEVSTGDFAFAAELPWMTSKGATIP